MHLGSIFRPEVPCPFDTAHIETAVSPPSYLLVWCTIHFHHFKYHDPYNDSHMLTLCIHPWQLGGCGYRLPALSHCFTPFITYRAFRGRDITNGYDSVETHFKQRPSGRTRYDTCIPILYGLNYFCPFFGPPVLFYLWFCRATFILAQEFMLISKDLPSPCIAVFSTVTQLKSAKPIDCR